MQTPKDEIGEPVSSLFGLGTAGIASIAPTIGAFGGGGGGGGGGDGGVPDIGPDPGS